MHSIRPYISVLILVAAITGASGCSNLGYYAQSVHGQLDILWKREPIAALLMRADTAADLKERLAKILRMRDFASQTLHLPDNGSYRSYADLNRAHVVWTVHATPEFSLDARQWCFPFAGCVSYRGHFSPEAAAEFAAPLRANGDDVYVGSVDAYSTLGWFNDPVLNTFIRLPEPYLAGLIFHELAHQQLYVKNDTTFNESFARAVEQAGVRLWLAENGTPLQLKDYALNETRRADFISLITTARTRLRTLYSADLPEAIRRAQKQQAFQQLAADYAELKQRWGGYAGYDGWFADQVNNAKLAAVATYADAVPAFEALLKQQNDDFAAFYAAAKDIGALPEIERKARLEKLVSKF